MFIKKLSSFCFKNSSAVFLCLFGALFYSFLIVYKYLHFSYRDWDQALINQSLWDLWHGQRFSSLYGFNIFGDHSTFINLLVLPLFVIFPHPLTVSFLEVFLFSASALLLYFMVLEDLDKHSAFFITLAYLIFLPNFFTMCHDFNTEALAPFFILLVIWFFRKKQLRNFYFSFIFLFLFKENMPLIVAMVGIWGLSSKDRNRMLWGALPIALSLLYFLTMVRWVIPHFHGIAQSPLWVRYRYLGSSPQEIFYNLLHFKILKAVFTDPSDIHYLLNLFGIFLVPALFSPSVLLLILPIVMYHLLSNHTAEQTIYYYYAVIMTPVIILASVQTLKKFRILYPLRRYICWVFIAGCCIQIYTDRYLLFDKIGLNSGPHISQEWKLVKMIPPNAAVVATFKFLPALSLRENLYSFHKIYREEYQNPKLLSQNEFYTGKIFDLPHDVSFALIDFNDLWLQEFMRNPYVSNRVSNFLKGWVPIASAGSVKLYERLK